MRLSLLIICGLLTFAAHARQHMPAYDSSQVSLRVISPSSIDSIAVLQEFRYDREPVETPSLWDRFWSWFWDTYYSIIQTESGKLTMQILLWVIGIGAIAFFLYKVMRMNRQGLFTGDNDGSVPYRVEADNIHAIAFEQAIADAIAAGSFRLATRLLYLQSLKMLADQNLINWKQGKTNADYQRELGQTRLYAPFTGITRIFEYVWYGNHVLPKEDFEAARMAFTQFQQSIKQP